MENVKPEKSGTLVCQGAKCTCTMAGSSIASLKVITQQKYYINDNEGVKKLMATNLEKTVASLNFKICKPGTKGATPCNASLQWQRYYDDVILGNGGSILMNTSIAHCCMAGGIIRIIDHGQSETVSNLNVQQVANEIHNQLNPFEDISDQTPNFKSFTQV